MDKVPKWKAAMQNNLPVRPSLMNVPYLCLVRRYGTMARPTRGEFVICTPTEDLYERDASGGSGKLVWVNTKTHKKETPEMYYDTQGAHISEKQLNEMFIKGEVYYDFE